MPNYWWFVNVHYNTESSNIIHLQDNTEMHVTTLALALALALA